MVKFAELDQTSCMHTELAPSLVGSTTISLLTYLDGYNTKCKQWAQDISTRGKQQHSSHIWFGGRIFEDGTLEEFDKDCWFPCGGLSNQSSQSVEDQCFSYNFDNID